MRKLLRQSGAKPARQRPASQARGELEEPDGKELIMTFEELLRDEKTGTSGVPTIDD